MSRLDKLNELLKLDENDSFVRYGVAMELAKAGRFAEAIAQFDELLKRDPKYVAGYFMGGRTQEQAGDIAAAKTMYERGVAMAKQVGDMHAAGEIQQALDMLP